MKKLSSDELRAIIIAVILMALGILFCCSLSIGIEGLSIIIGLSFIIIGLILLITALAGNKGLFSIEGIIGVLILALGILFLVDKLAGIIFAYIPWFLIVMGAVAICEALIDKFVKKNARLVVFIIKLIIGVASITLGLCLKFVDGFMEYAAILLGIFMIIYSGYMIYNFFVNKKSAAE